MSEPIKWGWAKTSDFKILLNILNTQSVKIVCAYYFKIKFKVKKVREEDKEHTKKENEARVVKSLYPQ